MIYDVITFEKIVFMRQIERQPKPQAAKGFYTQI